jgi:predicted enzyme related to lactoylglutathione lyase
VLFDPQGAAFGIHASGDEDGNGGDAGQAAPRAGDFSWHELATNAVPAIAFAFYKALFDWDEITQYDMGPMGTYLIFGRNGRQLGGVFDKGAAGKAGSAYWLGYVSVTDLEGTVERATAARGSVLTGPMDVPGGDRIAQLMDPYGAFFALHVRAGTQAGKPKRAKAEAASKPAAKPTPAKKAAAARKRPAKKAAAKKKPAPRKGAKKKTPARKAAPRKAAKKKAKSKPKKR